MIKLNNDSGAFVASVAQNACTVTCLHALKEGFIELEYTPPFPLDGSEYIFMPACCYNGNRFRVLPLDYPPLYSPGEAGLDMPVTISDVPRLAADGSGVMEVTTGDVSVPCVGIFSPSHRRGVLVYTIQQIEGRNLGLRYGGGSIGLTWPHMRKGRQYRWPHMAPSTDRGIPFAAGQTTRIPFKVVDETCGSITDFLALFFSTRKCMGLPSGLAMPAPVGELWPVQRDKFNTMNWREPGRFYGVGTTDEPFEIWQPGWIGGGMATLALMRLGGETEWRRGISTLDHLFRTQTKSGFFCERSDAAGNSLGIGYGDPGTENWHLVRKSADVLYFLFLHFKLMEEHGVPVPGRYTAGARRLADAFVTLWRRHGQFGQFISLTDGTIAAGGSTCGAIAPAGLVAACEYFNEPTYLEIARLAATQYCERDLAGGYTTGGPEEALQCPDSESAFALLESCAALYRHTGEAVWLQRAKAAAHLCSTWVVAYNYQFPKGSEFARLGMKSAGTVFANLQNKHAAPGICTLPGTALYHLYRWTGEEQYLEQVQDIAFTLPQFMSTEQRPIYSWAVPKDASLLEGDIPKVEPERLPPGFICERVNLSDWEGYECIGGVFNGSCWSETSLLLTLSELAPLLGWK